MKYLTAKYYADLSTRAGKFHSDVILVKSNPMLYLSLTDALQWVTLDVTNIIPSLLFAAGNHQRLFLLTPQGVKTMVIGE